VGDLNGVTAKLDYLDDLGVETLWLMPIFAADAVAGYGVVDHTDIAPEYGTFDDLAVLLDEAHARGIRVILDLPFNHVSSSHPWFQDALAGVGRERFLFADIRYDDVRWFPAGDGTYYYAFFGAALPDLDWRDPGTAAWMLSMMKDWLAVGVDGFRLDAVSTLIEAEGAITHSDETHALLAALSAALRADHPDVVLLAEAGEPDLALNLDYLGSTATPEATAVLDFPRREALLAAVAAGNDASALRDVLALEAGLDAVGEEGAHGAFVGSHDVSRPASLVPDERVRRLLLAAQLLLPGSPVLYYGDELGLVDCSVASGQDLAWRAAMPWANAPEAGFTTGTSAWFTPDPSYRDGVNVADEEADPDSLLQYVRRLAATRSELVAATRGRPREVGGEGAVVSVRRGEAGREWTVVLNFGEAAVVVEAGSVPGWGCIVVDADGTSTACG
jgi:glycosidase